MANKDKKGFNAGVYAIAASIVLAVVLVVLTIFTVATKYTAFSPEKLAQAMLTALFRRATAIMHTKQLLFQRI